MSRLKSGSKLNAPRAEIQVRRKGREVLIRGVLHDRRSDSPVNVDELTAAVAHALREALK